MAGIRRAAVVAPFLLLFLCYTDPLLAGTLSLNAGGARINQPVRSFQEIRQARTIRQQWDRSCGAAALSTILSLHYGERISEAVIIVAILQNTDPARIRARGGFSLLDLKQFAQSRGYEARGYGSMTLAELGQLGAPAIVPLRIRGYDHFAVFRGVYGESVLISDPAFGTLTMKIPRFLAIWRDGIGFVVTRDGSPPPPEGLAPQQEEFLIPDGGAIVRTNLRLSLAPLTRLHR
jgi:hypothetical protein